MSKIKFIEDGHKYINEENGHEYLSVSKLLGLYKNKFDAENISKRVAKKQGITQEEVLKNWDSIREFACERGTDFHQALEDNIKTGEVCPLYKKVIENFQLCISKNINNIESIFSEILCYNDEFEIAGTSDICWHHTDNSFTIGDFKTNKQFRYNSNYNDWLKYPINHLSECEFNNYTLQLSLYAFMYEIMTGKKCRGLIILWLDQQTGKWVPIRCNFMKFEIIFLLKDFYKNKYKNNISNVDDNKTI